MAPLPGRASSASLELLAGAGWFSLVLRPDMVGSATPPAAEFALALVRWVITPPTLEGKPKYTGWPWREGLFDSLVSVGSLSYHPSVTPTARVYWESGRGETQYKHKANFVYSI